MPDNDEPEVPSHSQARHAKDSAPGESAARDTVIGCLALVIVLALIGLGAGLLAGRSGWYDGVGVPVLGILTIVVATALFRRLMKGHGCLAFIGALILAGIAMQVLLHIGPNARFHGCVDSLLGTPGIDRARAEGMCR